MRAVVLDAPGPPEALQIRDRPIRAGPRQHASRHPARHEGHGVVCVTGMLSNQWTVPDFYPLDFIPNGVRLTAYGGDASDLPADVLRSFLDDVTAGRLSVPIHRVYDLDEIVTAHADMEAGNAAGKLVVVVGS
jgi:NADPH:quinone reductase-like Zn-dependent oxidoreductase